MYLSGMAHPHCSTNLALGKLALNKLEKVLDDVEGAMVTSASGARCAVAVDAGTCTPLTVVAVAGAPNPKPILVSLPSDPWCSFKFRG